MSWKQAQWKFPSLNNNENRPTQPMDQHKKLQGPVGLSQKIKYLCHQSPIKRKRIYAKKKFKEVIAKNFPNLPKDTNSHI